MVAVNGGPSGLRQAITIGPHGLVADEPRQAGGNDEGPDPYEFLLVALGACTSMTLRMYAERKSWPLEEVRVALTHAKSYMKDCIECEERPAMLDNIERHLTLLGPLTDEQRQRLLAIADRCPVHRTLTSKVRITTTLEQ
jgi:putative redox protein